MYSHIIVGAEGLQLIRHIWLNGNRSGGQAAATFGDAGAPQDWLSNSPITMNIAIVILSLPFMAT